MKRISVKLGDCLCTAVPELLTALLKRVRKAEPHVLQGDPEKGIHDMRVATKRFRETMRLYRSAFRERPFRRHLKNIERVNDLLGEVRDRDVLLARLFGYGDSESQLTGILRVERERAQQKLVRALDKLSKTEYWSALAGFVNMKSSYHPDARLEPAAAFGRAQLESRLATLNARWELVTLFPTSRNLHALRIANKKMRYALEPLLESLPKRCMDFYQALDRLHDALGDIHDDDVLSSRIEETADSPKRSTALRESYALTRRDRRRHETEFRRAAASLEVLGGFETLLALIVGKAIPGRKHFAGGIIEHEFKFLLKGRPALPATAETQLILQGYLKIGASEERVRMKVSVGAPSYFHTLKWGRGSRRIEREEEIDGETFFDLWAETDGLQIEKVRYGCREGGVFWEIDRYLDRNLWVAEVEVPSEQAEAPAFPAWLAPWVARDVSKDRDFRNQALAD